MKNLGILKRIKSPLVSEKSATLSAQNNEYVFKVSSDATKGQVKAAIEVAFDVKVRRVNVLNVGGKIKRFGRYTGQRSDWKKAYVKLEPGFSIDISAA